MVAAGPAREVDPRPFMTAGPTRRKILLDLARDEIDRTLDVHLTVPLDATVPAEQAALRLSQDSLLDVRYRVPLDLRAHRKTLGDDLKRMYRSPVGELLRADPIQPL